MSVDTLRRAASLMRERANAATAGPWEAGEHCIWSRAMDHRSVTTVVVSDGQAGDGGVADEATTEHIASWHPNVALAVADWLDATAARYEAIVDNFAPASAAGAVTAAENVTAWSEALAVARAYLGEPA